MSGAGFQPQGMMKGAMDPDPSLIPRVPDPGSYHPRTLRMQREALNLPPPVPTNIYDSMSMRQQWRAMQGLPNIPANLIDPRMLAPKPPMMEAKAMPTGPSGNRPPPIPTPTLPGLPPAPTTPPPPPPSPTLPPPQQPPQNSGFLPDYEYTKNEHGSMVASQKPGTYDPRNPLGLPVVNGRIQAIPFVPSLGQWGEYTTPRGTGFTGTRDGFNYFRGHLYGPAAAAGDPSFANFIKQYSGMPGFYAVPPTNSKK